MTTMEQAVGTPPARASGPAVDPPAAPQTRAWAGLGLARDLIGLVRPHQWAKNLLVVPLALLDPAALRPGPLYGVAWALLGFVLASALVYVINDIADRHRDRAHPTKRLRPIAAGRVPVPLAWAHAALLAGALITVALTGAAVPWWPLGAYLVLNIAYSRGLKHVPLVDVFIVAVGFVLRVVQGYLAAGVKVPAWLLIAVFAACLLMILGKRRHEVSAAGTAHRPALRGYSAQYLEYLIVLCAVLAISAFLMYLNTAVPPPYTAAALLGSVPFALFALARYLQVVVVGGSGGEPVRVLLRDRAMVVNATLWAVLLGTLLFAAQFPTPFGPPGGPSTS